MLNPTRCPLCGNKQPSLLEQIPVQVLAGKYRRFLGEGIAAEFSSLEAIGFFHCEGCDLRFFSPPVAGSEAFYEKLQRFDWYYLQEKAEYDYARLFLSEADDVLEIGAGEGFFSQLIRPKSYLGLELSARAVTRASEKGVPVVRRTAQEEAVRCPESYDVVCSFQVLEHIADPRGFLAAAAACLRPGGRLILSVPSADSYLSSLEDGLLNLPPHHLTWWSDRALEKAAEITGLERIGVEHERLADIHVAEYGMAVCLQGLKRLLRRRHSLLCRSLIDRLLLKAAILLSPLVAKGLEDRNLRPVGHSVTVVFRKPSL